MRIGELARLSGVRPVTLRYYERRGLVAPPVRTASGYRDYTLGTVAQLRLIGWAKELGFTLREIRELTAPVGRHAAGRGGEVRARVRAKIAELDERIARLSRIRAALEAVASCPCTKDCPIVADVLSGTP